MSKVHLARSGFITKAALPSITRARGTVSGPSNLLLFGAGKTTVANNTTFIDSSTNAFTVTRNGDTVHSGHNPFGTVSDGSAYFDGTGDYLSFPSNSAFAFPADFTIEYWINVASGTPTIIDLRGATGIVGFSDYYSSGLVPNIFKEGAGTILTASAGMSYNVWNHVAYVRLGTTLTIYINGVASGSVTDTTSWTAPNISGRISGNKDGTSIVNGYISNLRVVKGTAVYTSSFTPPTAPLSAITNTSLLLLTNNYSIVNSTSTPLPVTIVGNTTISTAQYPTGMTSSIYFDGAGDCLGLAANKINLSTGDFTIEGWVYRTASGSLGGIYDGIFSIQGYGTGWNDGGQGMAIGCGNIHTPAFPSGGKNFSSSVPLNQWTHIAVTRSSGTFRVFLNGVQVVTFTDTSAIGNGSVGFPTLGQFDNGRFYLTGYISNFRIVTGIAIYTANFTPSSLPLSVNVSIPNYVSNAIYGVNQLA